MTLYSHAGCSWAGGVLRLFVDGFCCNRTEIFSQVLDVKLAVVSISRLVPVFPLTSDGYAL